MNFIPLISRELLSEARQSNSYWLRWVCALSMAIFLGSALISSQGMVVGQGNRLFGVLQPTLFSLIWILVPVLTCDAISRERREGTLGLLLLTPLRPVDVAVAKVLSGGLRSLTLVLSSLPILAIPILSGGVSGADLIRGALMEGMALVASVAAGFLASSLCRQFHRAAILSIGLSLLALLLLGYIQLVYAFFIRPTGFVAGSFELRPEIALLLFSVGSWVVCSGIFGVWQSAPTATDVSLLWVCFAQLLSAVVFLLWVMVRVNRELRGCLADTGLTARQERWWRRFFTPLLFGRRLDRANQRLRDRNPIGWLQRRTRNARLNEHGWVLGVLLVEAVLLWFAEGKAWFRSNELLELQTYLAPVLILAMAFSAVNSWRGELETGALELLLVTPLTAPQIVRGRLAGLWGLYLPGAVILLGCYLAISSWDGASDRTYDDLQRLWLIVVPISIGVFLSLPIIGLDQSLRASHFLIGWVMTLGLGVLLPICVPLALHEGYLVVVWGPYRTVATPEDDLFQWLLPVVVLVLQASVAWASFRSLVRRLSSRSFVSA